MGEPNPKSPGMPWPAVHAPLSAAAFCHIPTLCAWSFFALPACSVFPTPAPWRLYLISLVVGDRPVSQIHSFFWGLPWWLREEVKNPPANAGLPGLIPVIGRCPEEGSGNPLQYSRLGNPMDRGAWRTTVPMVAKSWTWLTDSNTTLFAAILLTLVLLSYEHELEPCGGQERRCVPASVWQTSGRG